MKNAVLKILGVIMALGFLSNLIVNPVQASSDERHGGPGGQNQAGGMTNQRGNSIGTGLSFVETEPLSSTEVEGLQASIVEEYMAQNTYAYIIAKYGQVLPFSRIINAEQKHTEALLRLADYYNVAVPQNEGQTFDFPYSTLAEACQVGVNIETLDAADLQKLLSETENPNLIKVYTNLMNASLNRHLVAFEACN